MQDLDIIAECMEERAIITEHYGFPKSEELEVTKFSQSPDNYIQKVIVNKIGTCRVSYRTIGFMAGSEGEQYDIGLWLRLSDSNLSHLMSIAIGGSKHYEKYCNFSNEVTITLLMGCFRSISNKFIIIIM